MTTIDAPLLSQVRCGRCRARLFDTRLAWRPAQVSMANVLIQCWRCGLLCGLRLSSSQEADDATV